MFKKENRVKRSEAIVFGKPGNNSVKEAITRLKDNILYFNSDGNKNVIQIESSFAGEAKTTIISNLAVALGLAEKKVCLLDLDFKKQNIHRLFMLDGKIGLGDYMVGKASKETIIQESKYKNVSIISRGSEINNSSFVLTSEKLKNLILELRKEFDFVLLDCPPVLLVSDYIHISRLSDGVLFVVAFAKTKRKQVTEAINLLRQNNINIIGCAFSFYNAKLSSNYSEYKYYYGYGYNHYGQAEDKID